MTSAPSAMPDPSPEPELLRADAPSGSPRERMQARLSVLEQSHAMSRRHLWRAATRFGVLVAIDVATVWAFVAVVDLARTRLFPGSGFGAWLSNAAPSTTMPVMQAVLGVVLGLIALGNYGPGDARRDGARLLAGTYVGFALPYWSHLWQATALSAATGYIVAAFLVGALLLVQRHVLDALIYRFWPVGAGAARTLVIGTREDMTRASLNPALADRRGFRLCGRFDVRSFTIATTASLEEALCRSIRRHRADTLLLTVPLADEHFEAVVSAASASGCEILSLARSFVLGAVEPRVIWVRGTPIVQLNRPTLRGWQLAVKRGIDITASAAGLLVLAPLLLLVALAVKLSSRGPVLFSQVRVGLGGSHFKILKFRSMVADAEERRRNLISRSLYTDGRLFKMKNDPRVTRLGAIMRRTSIDELPQLWNVLRGEMSLVGPRPPLPAEVELYEAHHYARFEVKPGITGPWQAGGRNQITDFEQVVALEAEYIRNWSVWRDLEILLRTIPAVLDHRGAH